MKTFTHVKEDGKYDTIDQTNCKKGKSSEINDPLNDDVRLKNADASNNGEAGDNLEDMCSHTSRTFLCVVSYYTCRIKVRSVKNMNSLTFDPKYLLLPYLI